MKFCHVTISTKSLNESVQFYQNVIGLTLRRQFSVGAGFDIAFLGGGETEVELVCNQADMEVAIGQGISLGFEVESLSESIELLRLNDIEPGEIVQLGPKVRCLFISDPNSVRIQLVEHLK